MPNPANPQSFNRYTYCLNNPLKYIDPSGHGDYDYYDEYTGPPPDYGGYLNEYRSGNQISYTKYHNSRGGGAIQPVLPKQPEDKIFTVHDIFQLYAPLASGYFSAYIKTTWNDNELTTYIETSIADIQPRTSLFFAAAELNEARESHRIFLENYEPEGEYIGLPNSVYQRATRIYDVSLESPITLNLTVNAFTSTWDISGPSSHQLGYSTRIVIWEGRKED